MRINNHPMEKLQFAKIYLCIFCFGILGQFIKCAGLANICTHFHKISQKHPILDESYQMFLDQMLSVPKCGGSN